MLWKNANRQAELLNTVNVTTALEEKIVLFIASAKFPQCEGASHHPAFKGNCPSISQTLVSLIYPVCEFSSFKEMEM